MSAIIYLLKYAVIGVGICGIIIAAFNIPPTYKINYIDYSDQSDENPPHGHDREGRDNLNFIIDFFFSEGHFILKILALLWVLLIFCGLAKMFKWLIDQMK